MAGTNIPMDAAAAGTRRRGSLQRAARFALGCGLGMLAAVCTGMAAHWLPWLSPVAILPFVLIVACTALLGGVWPAAVVALASAVVQGGPIARLTHWNAAASAMAALALLVLTALFVSRLAARGDEQSQVAETLNRRMRELYEFTRRTLQIDLHEAPGKHLAELVREIFALEAVVIFDADLHEVYRAGNWSVDPQEMAQNVYHFETSDDDAATGLGRRVVRLGAVPIGSLVVRGESSPLTNDAIASLIAITFDRYRSIANEGRIEAARRAEQLRTTVLDGLAHAYKTPLTAIRAASTGLSEMGKLSLAQSGLASLITEQADLLNELTTRLLTTARLDADEVAVHSSTVSVGPMIDEAVASLGERRAATKIAVDLADEGLELCCDRRLMVLLLTQYIDNASKYSKTGGPVTIRAARASNEVVFSVHSFGPVIPMVDRERIFDRYYRSSASAHQAPGTGIGLSVAKRAAMIHGGSVWVSSEETEGTTFYAAIPAETTERGL